MPFESMLAQSWCRLHCESQHLAALAELGPEPFEGEIARFAIAACTPSRADREFATRAVEDLRAVLRPAIETLEMQANARIDVRDKALELWLEFHEARKALLALAAATGRPALGSQPAINERT